MKIKLFENFKDANTAAETAAQVLIKRFDKIIDIKAGKNADEIIIQLGSSIGDDNELIPGEKNFIEVKVLGYINK